jgi:hypothetical protein
MGYSDYGVESHQSWSGRLSRFRGFDARVSETTRGLTPRVDVPGRPAPPLVAQGTI